MELISGGNELLIFSTAPIIDNPAHSDVITIWLSVMSTDPDLLVGVESIPSPSASSDAMAEQSPNLSLAPTLELAVSAQIGANLRSGPGTIYPKVGGKAHGTALIAVGQHHGWFVLENGTWISETAVTFSGDNILPTIEPIEPPPPPTVTNISYPSPTPAESKVVPLPTPAQPAVIIESAGRWYGNAGVIELEQNGSSINGLYMPYGKGDSSRQAFSGEMQDIVLNGILENGISIQMRFNSKQPTAFEGKLGSRPLCGVRNGVLPPGCGFSGQWFIFGDSMPPNATANLQQEEALVRGTYSLGHISGQVSEYALAGNWRSNASGSFYLELVDLNSAVGFWNDSHVWCFSHDNWIPSHCAF